MRPRVGCARGAHGFGSPKALGVAISDDSKYNRVLRARSLVKIEPKYCKLMVRGWCLAATRHQFRAFIHDRFNMFNTLRPLNP